MIMSLESIEWEDEESSGESEPFIGLVFADTSGQLSVPHP